MAIQSVCTDPVTTTGYLFVAILLTSGVLRKGFLFLRVLDSGRELEISIVLLQPFHDMIMLHKKWITYDNSDPCFVRKYHPKFLSFGLFLEVPRKKADDPIESVWRVALRIPVQQEIFSRTHLSWYDSPISVLYLDLKAPNNS